MSFWKKIKGCGHELMPNCREALRSQSDMMDRPATITTRLGLWLHLILCKWCRRYGQHLRFLRTAAHEHEEKFTAAAPGQLSTAARDRIKEQLRGKN